MKTEERPFTKLKDLETQSSVQEIKISECGEYIVLSHETTTTVVKIPAELLGRNRMSLGHLLNGTSATESQLAHLGSTDVAAFGFKKGQVLNNTTCIVSSSGETTGHILESRGGDKPSIRLTHLDPDKGLQALEFVSLPLSNNVEHTTLTAMLPKSQHDSLRVLINSKSRAEYSMKDDNDYYPALINRRITSVKHVTRPYARDNQPNDQYVSRIFQEYPWDEQNGRTSTNTILQI